MCVKSERYLFFLKNSIRRLIGKKSDEEENHRKQHQKRKKIDRIGKVQREELLPAFYCILHLEMLSFY